jgi:nucleoside-diphosphate-sugar epimerase
MTDAADTKESTGLHVVFGAGQVGSQLVDRLLARGQRVRSVRRSAEVGRHPMHQTVRADLLDREATIRAAAGASVVYHCANAPYHEWSSRLPPICRHIAAAAQAARARLIVLDNVYAVGATGSFDETTPERPCSRKGALRKQLADELRALHARGELSVTIGRASDFFGPHVDQGVLQHPRAMDQLLAGRTVDVIGALDQPHSWSYAPDVAEGLLRLGMRPDLGGQTLHLPVLPPQTAGAMLALLAKELGVPHRARRMPPWMLRVAGWFSPLMRELPEMQYQFDAPFVMLDGRARRLLAMEPTPLDEQTRATAAWMRERSRTSAGSR